jgi:hypothetical protein
LCGSSGAHDFGWECIAENQLTGKTTFAHIRFVWSSVRLVGNPDRTPILPSSVRMACHLAATIVF